jgi:hypothetical protein
MEGSMTDCVLTSDRAQRKLSSRDLTIVKRSGADLTDEEIQGLWLFHSRFVSRTRESFVTALADSDAVWVLRENARVAGFATTNMMYIGSGPTAHTVIYTKWAFVEPHLRKRGFVQRVGLLTWLAEKWRHPLRPVSWVFTASTVDSYIHMLRSSAEAYPRHGRAMPPHLREVLDQCMAEFGGANWDAASGTLKRNGEVAYKEGLVDPTSTDPDAQYYSRANPRQDRGDSIACIAPATAAGLAVYLSRFVVKSLRAAIGLSRPAVVAKMS